jgi:hypothetical protein
VFSWRFGRGFGFTFFPSFRMWFEPFPRRSEYLKMLKQYRDELKKELEEVEKNL